jgi:hypothetical protein
MQCATPEMAANDLQWHNAEYRVQLGPVSTSNMKIKLKKAIKQLTLHIGASHFFSCKLCLAVGSCWM